MTNSFPNPLDALAGLLDERKRYETWLAQLDAHRSNAPGHVLDRVRGDYQERLKGVVDQLRARGSELEASAASMAERISGLLAEETARRDERAEAELRAAVGEFSVEYARDLLSRCDEAIGRLSGERGVVGTELERVQEIIALVRRPAVAPPPPAPAPAAATVAPAAPAPAPVAPPHLTPDAGGTFDELAFLQSVVQPRNPPAAPPTPAPASPNYGSMPLGARHAPHPLPTEPSEGAAPSRLATETPSGIPSFLKDMPEQVKTLKCQECGTMNYATEWYCERCGGELAAM
jgi:hypothetical protein